MLLKNYIYFKNRRPRASRTLLKEFQRETMIVTLYVNALYFSVWFFKGSSFLCFSTHFSNSNVFKGGLLGWGSLNEEEEKEPRLFWNRHVANKCYLEIWVLLVFGGTKSCYSNCSIPSQWDVYEKQRKPENHC